MEYSGNLDLEEGELPEDVAGATGEAASLMAVVLFFNEN